MTDREAQHREIAERFLPDELVSSIRERAGEYDRANEFFAEDLEALRDSGYLTTFVPESHGGPGLTLNQVSRLQQRLAGAAPATALGINMHLLCVGVARALHERGDDSLDYVFAQALAGEIFAFGISEPGNDFVLADSKTHAVPTNDGGFALTGTKIFTSLTPAWTKLIVHGRDESGEEPQLVFGFLDRDDEGVQSAGNWDVLGMRASHSRATRLTGAVMPAGQVIRTLPIGPTADALVFAIASHFQLLVGSVYAGVAARALEVAAVGLTHRNSAKAESTLAEVPEFRARIADAHMTLLPVAAQLDAYTRDIDELVNHGERWPLLLVHARINAGDVARRNAEVALACAGGAGFSAMHEASRLYRDAAASLFHPPGVDAARPMFAAALLGE